MCPAHQFNRRNWFQLSESLVDVNWMDPFFLRHVRASSIKTPKNNFFLRRKHLLPDPKLVCELGMRIFEHSMAHVDPQHKGQQHVASELTVLPIEFIMVYHDPKRDLDRVGKDARICFRWPLSPATSDGDPPMQSDPSKPSSFAQFNTVFDEIIEKGGNFFFSAGKPQPVPEGATGRTMLLLSKPACPMLGWF